MIGILEFEIFLTSMGYPTGKIIRAGTSMVKILYRRVYVGNSMGIIFTDWYVYEMVLPGGYVYPLNMDRGVQ